MRFQPRRTEDPEINLTSLIDVVLLLVIFFMVSTSFTVDGRLRLQLPGSSVVPARQPADGALVSARVAVVGRGEDGDAAAIVFHNVALLLDLV
jgi:biopolymer transport protein ExbD